MDREPDFPKSEGANATVVYMVSIYLLLIAFFVILHTISVKEEVRASAVVGSLRVTFQRPEQRMDDLPQNAGEPRFSGPNAEFRDYLAGYFGDFLTTARFSRRREGEVLQLDLDPKAFFYDGTATLRADRTELMRLISEMLSNPQPYRRNAVEIWFETEGGADTTPARGLELRRAGMLARDLEAGHVDPQLVTIGLRPGRGGEMHIAFTATAEHVPPAGAGQ